MVSVLPQRTTTEGSGGNLVSVLELLYSEFIEFRQEIRSRFEEQSQDIHDHFKAQSEEILRATETFPVRRSGSRASSSRREHPLSPPSVSSWSASVKGSAKTEPNPKGLSGLQESLEKRILSKARARGSKDRNHSDEVVIPLSGQQELERARVRKEVRVCTPQSRELEEPPALAAPAEMIGLASCVQNNLDSSEPHAQGLRLETRFRTDGALAQSPERQDEDQAAPSGEEGKSPLAVVPPCALRSALVLPGSDKEPAPRKSASRVAWGKAELADREPELPLRGPARAVSLPPIGRGSLDEIRRRVEEEIVKRNPTSLSLPEGLLSRRPAKLLEALVSYVDLLSLSALRFGGVLPWGPSHFKKSLAYRLLVLALHGAILASFVVRARASFSQSIPFLISDMVIACGSVGGLVAVGALTGSQHLQESLTKLEDSVKQQDFQSTVELANTLDTLLTLGAWLVFVADRLSLMLVRAHEGVQHLPWGEILHYVAVVVASAELSILVLAVLRVTRNMVGLVDAFCTECCSSTDYTSGVEQWNIIQASIRMASSAVEKCFAILQSVLVLTALAMVFDFQGLQGSTWALSASGVLILGLSQILLRAAAVTDACVRVSQLVNAMSLTDDLMDPERMYLVDYITASAAGFYIFNVRLGAGIAIKVLHYTGLMAFTIARLVLPANGV